MLNKLQRDGGLYGQMSSPPQRGHKLAPDLLVLGDFREEASADHGILPTEGYSR